jgi:hypothetical protein
MKIIKIISESIAVLLTLSLFSNVSFAQQPTATVQPSDAAVANESPQLTETPSGTSTIRIVRLSQIKGNVLLDRQTDRGFEVAFPNLPIAQGHALKTAVGVAEVEFEDNSSLRITPNSLIQFPALQRSPTGATITTVNLVSGTLYVSLAKTRGNDFTILVGGNKITVAPSSHIRLDVGAGTSPSTLAVLAGSAQLTNASDTTTVDKKKTLTFNTSTQSPPVLISKVQRDEFDDWDKTSASYHNLRSISSSYGNPGYAYGISDLNYYGAFVNSPCGSLWQPYFAGAGWDPFANGLWAWYPGAGYSWVSPYPWGWTPFHYGSWQNCGSGWGWQPGGQWHGLRNHPTTLNPNHGPNCPRAPHAPVAGHPTLIAYNAHPLQASRIDAEGNFVFRKGSAGIGISRESFSKLNHFSANVERHGTLSVPTIYSQDAEHSANREGDPHNNSRSSDPQNAATRTSPNSAQSRSSSSASRESSSGWSGGSRGSSSPSSSGSWSGGSHSSAPAASSAPSSAPSSGGGGGGAHR